MSATKPSAATSDLISSHPPSAPPPTSIMTTPLPLTDPSIAPFLAHPWTASILSKSTTQNNSNNNNNNNTKDGSGEDKSYYPIQTWSRLFKPTTGEDGYFAHTLNTPSTIKDCLTLRRRTVPIPSDTVPVWPSAREKPSSGPKVDPPDVMMCCLLGEPGVSGHPGTVHGGVVATLMDEAMSLAVALQPAWGRKPHEGGGGSGNTNGSDEDEGNHPRGHIYTSQLDVRFRNPITAPGMVVVRAKVVARVGRKYWVRAHVVQEEDGSKTGGHLEWTKRKIVKADAMAFWLETTGAEAKL